ncbi:MAG: hypothetical protein U0359_20505 [Byssovorax sp.]
MSDKTEKASKLTCARAFRPETIDELDALQRKQLVAAAKLYDSQDLPAEARLADDGEETSFKGFLEVCSIVDEAGKPAYDAYLYMVDSGTIFRAGTTEVAAEIIQMGMECDDDDLGEALDAALAARAKTAPTGKGPWAAYAEAMDEALTVKDAPAKKKVATKKTTATKKKAVPKKKAATKKKATPEKKVATKKKN